MFPLGSYATGGAEFLPLRVYFYAKVENHSGQMMKHPVLEYLKQYGLMFFGLSHCITDNQTTTQDDSNMLSYSIKQSYSK